MSEWSNVPVSKTGEQKCSGGSNPPLCAKKRGEFSCNLFAHSSLSATPKKKKNLSNVVRGFLLLEK